MARKKHNRSRSFQIPLGVVAGFTPLALDAYRGGSGGGFSGFVDAVSYDMTGYRPSDMTFHSQGLIRGWGPILVGFAVHKLASRFGINRALAQARIPVLRI